MSDQPISNSEEATLFAQSVEFGAMEDKLDVGALWKWTVLTIIFVLALIGTGFQLHTYFVYTIAEEQAINSKYDILVNSQESAKTTLSTSGIVDESKGVYHIPIEKAIDLTVEAYKTK